MSSAPLHHNHSLRRRGLLPRRYCFVLAIWATISLAALTIVVRASLIDAEREFASYGEHFHAQIRDKLRANEAVLYGFASFISAIDRDDREKASLYAQSMLERYPHIYMLEIARRVPRQELHSFTESMRRKWQRDFEIRAFDYRGERRWQPLLPREDYYPIILAEPDLPQSRDVIGLDVGSLDDMRITLKHSEKSGSPTSTAAFRLVEGDMAYVMFRPIPQPQSPRRQNMPQQAILGGATYAMAVVRATDLLPSKRELDRSVRHLAILSVERESEGAPLFDLAAEGGLSVSRTLFPTLRIERDLRSVSSQPLRLVLERQLGAGDISGTAIALVSLASVLSLALLLIYFGARRRHEISQDEQHRHMEHLALHDPLTGLPNRFLMFGRLEQALHTATRHGSQVAVLFLDLDGFKPINDRYGHATGDELLRAVAAQLRCTIRDCDTVARYGGDEFVVTLTDLQQACDIAAVAEKILEVVSHPVTIDDHTIEVSTSIGIATYPENGSDGEALIRAADAAMYEAKAEGRRLYRFATPGLETAIAEKRNAATRQG